MLAAPNMHRTLARACLAAVTLATLAACGGSAPPPQVPAVPAPTPPPPPPPPADVSAVPEPATLVVSARFGKLSASLATVHGWTKLPMPQSEQVTEILTSEAVGPLVDLDQPIDFAVAVTGTGANMKDLTALSAAVKDPEKAKASLAERYKLVPGENGVIAIQGLGKPQHEGADEDRDDDKHGGGDSARTCELAPAFGDAPVRLVCGLTAKAVAELGPWLTRTATRGPATGDLHVEVRMKPLQSTIADQKRLLGAILGSVLGARLGVTSLRNLAEAFGADVIDFAGDLDGASADVTLGDAGVQLSTTLKLAGTTSMLARLATAHPERSGPAPAAFWQLPGDADFAVFSRGVDEAQLARPRDLILTVVSDALGDSGVKDGDRKAVVDGLGKLISPAAHVYGSGLDLEAVRKAIATDRGLTIQSEQSDKDESKRQLVEALFGWRVIELDEPSAQTAAGLKNLAAAIDRPSVGAAYREKLKDAVPPSLRPVPVPKSAGLPAGAQHYLLELHTLQRKAPPPPRVGGKPAPPHKPLGPLKPVLVHIFLVPDGPRTWIAAGGDEAVTASRLATSLAPGADKLSARPGLESLKDGSVGAGGFFTTRSLPEVAQQLPLLFTGATWLNKESFDEAAQMPHHGMTPVPFSFTAQPGGPPSVTATRLTLPRDAIEDVVASVLRHGGF
jgi:hypothetical protein